MANFVNKAPDSSQASNNRLRTVAIVHGWAEGEWQSQIFRRLLENSNFHYIRDVERADIIVAHSSGCFLVPTNVNAQLIILVGPPYWPGRLLAVSVILKLFKEITHHRKNQQLSWWANKLIHNIWYIFSQPQDTYNAMTKHKLQNLPDGRRHHVVMVRPDDDTFTHPHIDQVVGDPNYAYVSVPGSHDECWIDPQAYVELIKRFARQYNETSPHHPENSKGQRQQVNTKSTPTV